MSHSKILILGATGKTGRRIVQRLAGAAEAGLPKGDKAKMRRWRSDVMRPEGEAIGLLARKINEDLADAMRRKERSPIRKPDWR